MHACTAGIHSETAVNHWKGGECGKDANRLYTVSRLPEWGSPRTTEGERGKETKPAQ
jgi:hypothetical protein